MHLLSTVPVTSMLPTGKHFYLKTPSLLEILSLLWNGWNWGPLSPAYQHPRPCQLSNTCFTLTREGWWWFMVYGVSVNSKRKKSYSIRKSVFPLWKPTLLLPGIPAQLWVEMVSNHPSRPPLSKSLGSCHVPAGNKNWRDSYQVLHIYCINKFTHLIFSRIFFLNEK